MIVNSNGVVAAAAETNKYEQVQRNYKVIRATNHQIKFKNTIGMGFYDPDLIRPLL